MKDQIRYSADAYEQLASRLASLDHELKSLASSVGRLSSSAESGVLSLGISGSISLSSAGSSYTYGSASGALIACRRALNACADASRSLHNSVQRASQLFTDNERALVIMAGTQGNGYDPQPPETTAADDQNETAAQMARGLSGTIAAIWQQIQDRIAAWNEERAKYADANKQRAFDDEGLYGGKQHGPLQDVKAGRNLDFYRDLIEQNTGRKLSDAQLLEYMSNMNQEGCGYMAMVNAIMQSYEGRAKDFERDFGYSMIGEDGDLNYNAMMVDFYSMTDDKRMNKAGQIYTQESKGSNVTTRQERMAIFAQEHNLSLDYKQITGKITPQNYSQYAQQGSVTVAVHPLTLRDANGQIMGSYNRRDAGHAMTVTGVTENGAYIVSTWGKVAYVYPSDYQQSGDRFQFTVCSLS